MEIDYLTSGPRSYFLSVNDGAAQELDLNGTSFNSHPPDPRGLPQHDLLRPRRVRRAGGGAGVLRHTDVQQLTPAQGAMLAAIIRSPGGYSPRHHLDRLQAPLELRARRRGQGGLADPGGQRAAAKFPKIVPRRRPRPARAPTATWSRTSQAELAAARHHRRRHRPRGGLKIYTTFDAERRRRPRSKAVKPRSGPTNARERRTRRARVRRPARPAGSWRCTAAPTTATRSTSTTRPRASPRPARRSRRSRWPRRSRTASRWTRTWDGRSGRVFTDVNGIEDQADPQRGRASSYGRSRCCRPPRTRSTRSSSTSRTSRRWAPRRSSRRPDRAGIPDNVVIDPTLSRHPRRRVADRARHGQRVRDLRLRRPAHNSPTAIAKVIGSNGGAALPADPQADQRVFDQDDRAPRSTTRCRRSSPTAPGRRRRASAGRSPARPAPPTATCRPGSSGYTPQLSTAVVAVPHRAGRQDRESLNGVGGLERVNGGVVPGGDLDAVHEGRGEGHAREGRSRRRRRAAGPARRRHPRAPSPRSRRRPRRRRHRRGSPTPSPSPSRSDLAVVRSPSPRRARRSPRRARRRPARQPGRHLASWRRATVAPEPAAD